jgi:hypothetical protein
MYTVSNDSLYLFLLLLHTQSYPMASDGTMLTVR